jgi:predicted secreted acid phosphatase
VVRQGSRTGTDACPNGRNMDIAFLSMNRICIALATLIVAAGSASAADAATTATPLPPAAKALLVDSGVYGAALNASWTVATAQLRAQLAGPRVQHPAVVLDIDETSLSNVGCLREADFDPIAGLTACLTQGRSTAIPAARTFVALAQALHVSVFFITSAPQVLCDSRTANLRAQGFSGPLSVTCRPAADTANSVVPYKSSTRAGIEAQGFTILLNVGDQLSDLTGGHARADVLLPDPFYTTT